MKNVLLKIFTLSLLLTPIVSNAQTAADYGYDDLSATNLGTRSLRDTIAGVINIALGFLGILAVVFIIWGGLNVMTSGGNSDKTGKGKDAIVAGVIGLVIILTAYAISRFVLGSLANETV